MSRNWSSEVLINTADSDKLIHWSMSTNPYCLVFDSFVSNQLSIYIWPLSFSISNLFLAQLLSKDCEHEVV